MAVEAGYWLGKFNEKTTGPQPRALVLVDGNKQFHHSISARVALKARTGLTQDELFDLACERRRQALAAMRPRQRLVAIGLLAAGIAMSIAGNGSPSLIMLLCGFGTAFAGAVVACSMLAAMLLPPQGELTRYIHDHEVPGTDEELATLLSASRTDADLNQVIGNWWSTCGPPIRKQDLMLVQTYLDSKNPA